MHFGLIMALLSAVLLAGELVVFKYLLKKNPDIDDTMLLWLFRWGAMGFMSAFLIYEILVHDEKVLRGFDLKSNMLWVVLGSFLSAAAAITLFRSIQHYNNVGVANALKSFSIPITFILSMIILNQKWSEVDALTYVGMGLMTAGVGVLVYGTLIGKEQ